MRNQFIRSFIEISMRFCCLLIYCYCCTFVSYVNKVFHCLQIFVYALHLNFSFALIYCVRLVLRTGGCLVPVGLVVRQPAFSWLFDFLRLLPVGNFFGPLSSDSCTFLDPVSWVARSSLVAWSPEKCAGISPSGDCAYV